MKIAVLGDRNTGKSTLVYSYVGKKLQPKQTRMGVCEHNYQDSIHGEVIAMKIYDSVEVSSDIVRCASGLVIVFNKHNVSSFQKLEKIISEAENQQHHSQPIVIASTFSDVPEPQLKGNHISEFISYEDGHLYASSIGAKFFEICTSSEAAVTELFHSLLATILINSPQSVSCSSSTPPPVTSKINRDPVIKKKTHSVEKQSQSDTPKIVIFGDGGAGKTAFTLRYLYDKFVPTDPNICDTYIKEDTVDDYSVVCHITDLAGQEEYAPLRCRYYRVSDCFIGLFSVTDKSSFIALDEMITAILREQNGNRFSLILVGSKSDLSTSCRQVSVSDAKSLAVRWGALLNRGPVPFLEVSSVTGQNVKKAFHAVIRLKLNPPKKNKIIKPTVTPVKKKRCFLM